MSRVESKYLLTLATLLALASGPAMAQTNCGAQTFPSINSSPWLGQEMLGRVEANSINVNVVFDQAMQVYAQYGTASGAYTGSTPVQTAAAGVPVNITLPNLNPNTRYYYRLQYALPSVTTFTARPEHTFVTARPRGTPFTFLIQADPHLDNNSSTDVYKLTLANELQDNPDFLIDLGDTMLTDKLNALGQPNDCGASPTAAGVLARTQLHRSFYDLATHSIPLFVAVGNHEGEWSANLSSAAYPPPNNYAIWDTLDRTGYFSNPAPDGFFSGDKQFYDLSGNVCVPGQSVTCGLGQRRSYYSWEWGDALFIVLDPFWNQTDSRSTTGSGQTCCQKGTGTGAAWNLTLGSTQYNWLQQTLQNSTATYKFVFSHNLVGGLDPVYQGASQGPMRGGVEAAPYLEWGGLNLDGTYGFGTYRPGWPMPIHNMLVANHVTAYFHGHDHLYAHQTLDGIQYQEVPQPSASNGRNTTIGPSYGYKQGTILPGRGYVRVQVSPTTGVTVQFVETWLPSEATGNLKNGMVADSYVVPSPSSTGPGAAPTVSPGGIVPVYSSVSTIQSGSWISIYGTNLASSTATWTGNFPQSLGGTSVTINGKPAYLWYVSPTQINLQAPSDTATGPVPVVITTPTGTVSSTVTLAPSAPSFSLLDSKHVAGIILRSNGAGAYGGGTYDIIGPTGNSLGYATVAAKAGDTVELFAVGLGPTTPAVAAGQPFSGSAPTTNPVTLSINNVKVTPTYAGMTSAGLYQINLTIPAGLGTGDVSLTASTSGALTPTATISLQ